MRKILWMLVVISMGYLSAVYASSKSEPREGLSALMERAAGGDARALYNLAVLHDTGYANGSDTVAVDSTLSTALYLKSAQLGYAPAQNYIGFRYFNGEAVRQDVDSALFWLAKAAGGGDVKAANNLGFLLANSDRVTRDYPQAIFWFEKAAVAGLPSAQASLADLVRQGLGTEPDTTRAVDLYNRAIDGGLADAELKLLSMMGKKWEQLPPDSAVSLGKKYYLGRAPFIGVTLFENAAAENNPDALALLGDAYSRGIGVEYNHEKSLENFLTAALMGNAPSQFVIGELLDIFPDALMDDAPQAIIDYYFEGDPPEDINSAEYWYDLAADAGIENAETAALMLYQ